MLFCSWDNGYFVIPACLPLQQDPAQASRTHPCLTCPTPPGTFLISALSPGPLGAVSGPHVPLDPGTPELIAGRPHCGRQKNGDAVSGAAGRMEGWRDRRGLLSGDGTFRRWTVAMSHIMNVFNATELTVAQKWLNGKFCYMYFIAIKITEKEDESPGAASTKNRNTGAPNSLFI